jgi:hypothetical protein
MFTMEQILQLIPDTIETDITRVHLIFEERVIIAKSIADGLNGVNKKREPASVEDMILDGVCDECDQDPAQCFECGHCVYLDVQEANNET